MTTLADRTAVDETTERDAPTSIPIVELASVIRSKNCGPYELTFDIVFKDRPSYDFAVQSGVFTPELFATLYGIAVDRVLNVVFFAEACAIKATIVRPIVSGDVGETDVYGAQQHAPLLSITVPLEHAVKEGSEKMSALLGREA